MSGTVRHARLETRFARAKLKRGRQAHWQAIITGKVHLGYQRWPDESAGRWIFRRWIARKYRRDDGKYSHNQYETSTLGHADDTARANGTTILSYDQAAAAIRAIVDAPAARPHRLKVREAFERYVEFKRTQGGSVADLLSRARVHILPSLGNFVVSDLTAEKLRNWLAALAATPAQTRPKGNHPQYRTEPVSDEDIRRRRASANRVLTMLKAMLNHAYDEGHVSHRDAWGRKLKPFRDVEVARVRYLTVAEAARLINASDQEFRPLVRAALETGARYGELTRLEVSDFNPDAATVTVRKSKTGKARHIVLTQEGAAFFRSHCAGRARDALMFVHGDGQPWRASEQGRPMIEAAERAKLKNVTFHVLRHTYASLCAMNGVPMTVIAANLGHAAGSPVTAKHYAHLAPSHVREAIRAGAPKYNIKPDKRVVPLR
jgi:integrase